MMDMMGKGKGKGKGKGNGGGNVSNPPVVAPTPIGSPTSSPTPGSTRPRTYLLLLLFCSTEVESSHHTSLGRTSDHARALSFHSTLHD